MRLWTIQNTNAKNVIEDGVWYSSLGYRTKDVDRDYELEEIGYYPIYTFALLKNGFLNLDTLRRSIKDIFQVYRLPRDWSDVLIELEVKDEDIVNLKPVDCNFKDPEYFITEGFRGEVNRLVDLSKQVEISKYTFPSNFEAVLKCIKKEQVVSINTMTIDPEYEYCVFQSVYTNPEVGYPAWKRPVGIATDSTYHLVRTRDADVMNKKNMYKDTVTLVNSLCTADRASNDMTLGEALEFVNAEARVKLLNKFNKFRKDHPDVDRYAVTIQELFAKSGKE